MIDTIIFFSPCDDNSQFYDRQHRPGGIFVSQMTTDMLLFVLMTIWFFIRSWIITAFVTRVIRHVPHVEQEVLIH